VVRIQTRIFLGILLVLSAAFGLSLYWITEDLEPQYRKATEEPLVDSVRILASLAALNSVDGKIDVRAFERAFRDVNSHPFSARIYNFEKETVDFRIYITDGKGIVLFDSENRENVGQDFSQWNDVYLTLQGRYGARSTRDVEEDPSTSVMYVAAPIIAEGRTIGVLSVGKPVTASARFIKSAKRKILAGGTLVFIWVIVVVGMLSSMVTRPIQRLTEYARDVRDGRRVKPPLVGGKEVNELGAAFEEMRRALDGKSYIEEYVQSLTHEIKSPLSTITGAAELLREEMDAGQRDRFLDNILSESQRIGSVVEKLLLLSSLEAAKDIDEVSTFNLYNVVQDVRKTFLPQLSGKKISLEMTGDPECTVEGNRFLIRHTLSNLIQNALEFSPEGGELKVNIQCREDRAILTVMDRGSGIPEYAIKRVFDRFYSLKRPYTGLKGTGLGLSLAREVAILHNGSIEVSNHPDGGVLATLILPRKHGMAVKDES